MLQWNPTKRISAESALRDLYLNSYYNPSDEPVCTKQLDITVDEDKVTYLLILVSGFSAVYPFSALTLLVSNWTSGTLYKRHKRYSFNCHFPAYVR